MFTIRMYGRPTIKFLYVLVILTVAGLIGCEKEPPDYRLPYIGNFNFEVNSLTWNLAEGPISDTTYTSEGKIALAKGENELWIYLNGDIPWTVVLHNDGTLTSPNRLGGKFLNVDSLECTIYPYARGGGTTTRIKGVRK